MSLSGSTAWERLESNPRARRVRRWGDALVGFAYDGPGDVRLWCGGVELPSQCFKNGFAHALPSGAAFPTICTAYVELDVELPDAEKTRIVWAQMGPEARKHLAQNAWETPADVDGTRVVFEHGFVNVCGPTTAQREDPEDPPRCAKTLPDLRAVQ